MYLRKSCYILGTCLTLLIPMTWEFITTESLWLKDFLNNSCSSSSWGSVVSSRPDVREKKPQHRTVLRAMSQDPAEPFSLWVKGEKQSGLSTFLQISC